MLNIAYWDCFSGISGDMALGALVDAGLDLGALRAELNKLDVPGWELTAERGLRYGISGTHIRVRAEEQTTHRHLADIRSILHRSRLDAEVRDAALRVFSRLAEAEGAVHGMSPEAVHFHEVGALDAIVDIVGVVAGLRLLGVERVYASPLPLGSGWINAAHGRIPVPGPAVLALLGAVQAPTVADDTPFELVTPTGAALLAELATWSRPALRLRRTGYGFGSRDTGRLNAVRVWLGESANWSAPARSNLEAREHVVLLETNLDDQTGEQLAFAAEELLRAGALDVWWQPIGMKKGRPAVLFAVLSAADHEQALVDLLFRETSTLGIRRTPVERWTADRELGSVQTEWGPVRVKIKRWQGKVLHSAPEYEDCARLARETGVPLRTIYTAAERAAEGQGSPEAEGSRGNG